MTPASGAPITAKARGPYGVTVHAGAPITAKARGPYGVALKSAGPVTTKAKGPYGVIPATHAPTSAKTPAPSDTTSGWRVLAICEAALLLAFALGAMRVVPARRRTPRVA